MSWISDQEAERALDFLRDKAVEIGEARKRAILTERLVKRVLAIQMAKSDETTVAAKERAALQSPEYLEAIHDEAAAVGELEVQRALRDAAIAKIEAWRSLKSMEKAMMK